MVPKLVIVVLHSALSADMKQEIHVCSTEFDLNSPVLVSFLVCAPRVPFIYEFFTVLPRQGCVEVTVSLVRGVSRAISGRRLTRGSSDIALHCNRPAPPSEDGE